MRTRRILLSLVAVCLLAATACGARLNKEQVAALAANGGAAAADGTGAPAADQGAASDAGSGSTVPGADAGGTTVPGAQPGVTTPGGAVGGAKCVAAPGSKDPGVSDTEVKLGNVSTISGPIPGFGQTGVNAVKAYFNYINSQGGVCGRKLTLVASDDRLDAGANRSETDRLKNEVLGFVGGTTVVDDGGTAALAGTGIADCGLAIGAASIASPTKFSPNPIDPSGKTNGTTNMWAYFKATRGISKVAIVYPAQADARQRGQAYAGDIQAAGLAVDGPFEVAVTETNYAGVATKIKTDGADAVITTLEVNGMARLSQAFTQVGYTPKVPFYGAQAYGQQFLKLAGASANGTVLGLTYSIFEDAPNNKAMAAFVEWYKRTNPGSNPDFFSIMSWGAADMYVQALQQAGPAPTRAAVLKALQGFTTFDAHGLMSPRNPPGKSIGNQFMVVEIKDGKWVRTYPASGFGTGA